MISNFHIQDFSNGKPQTIVFVLHGYGSNGENLSDLANVLHKSIASPLFLCPDAPFPHEFMPEFGRQWFSLISRDENDLLQGAQIAYDILLQFINNQMQKYNVDYHNIVLVGFSQGCMMALYTALKLPRKCKAVIGFSGTMVSADYTLESVVSKPKICMIHGTQDSVVPCSYGKFTAKTLKNAGIDCEFHEIPNLDHTIDARCIEIAQKFLATV